MQKCAYRIKKAAGSIASGLPGSKLIPRMKHHSAPARFKLAAAPGDVESKIVPWRGTAPMLRGSRSDIGTNSRFFHHLRRTTSLARMLSYMHARKSQMRCGRTYRWTTMRRQSVQGAGHILCRPILVDCITNMTEFDLRQAQETRLPVEIIRVAGNSSLALAVP